MVLNFEDVSKTYGDRQILDHVTFYVRPGDRIGLVGVNGCGKSTLLSIAAHQEEADQGHVSNDPDIITRYLPQSPSYVSSLSVMEQMRVYCGEEPEEFEIRDMLSRLGILNTGSRMGDLSGGLRKRIALAGTLLGPSDFLILDEPTNHLDAEMIAWLETYLSAYSGAVLLVTHDRYFLERTARRTGELSFGKLYFYDGGYSAYLEGKASREEMLSAMERKRKTILRRELAWVLQGPCARGTKSKERLARYEEMKARLVPEFENSMQNIAAVSSRLGKKTIELKNISKSYDGKDVLSDFSYLLQRNDRIGIIGKNGAGKSTLLHIISGKDRPDTGAVEMGDTVKIGYFMQHAEDMNRNLTALEYVKQYGDEIDMPDGRISASKLMEKFLFSGTMQHKKISDLSGGELRRLYLLGILASAPNVLLLDEPTNDLDIPTMQVLEDYLDTFPGAIIAVSHDRYFLDRICHRLFALDGRGHVNHFTGCYTDWLQSLQPEKKPSVPSSQPNFSQRPEKSKKLKFSFKEQKEFETIEDDISALEEKIEKNKTLQGENSADYVKLMELQKDCSFLEEQLEEKMERWVYLNELSERIKNQ